MLEEPFEVQQAQAESDRPVSRASTCKAAIKDGDILDQASAIDLITRALRLPFPRCPHGRPIWVVLDKDTLYKMVGRLVE